MARQSFRDPVTHVLKAHGYVQSNVPSDVQQDERDDFALEPGKWQWNGTAWVPFTPPPVPPELPHPLIARIDAALTSSDVVPPLKELLRVWRSQL